MTDELVDLHDCIMIKLFSAATNKHRQDFQKQGKAINDKVRLYSRIGRALVEAKESGMDPYAAIEAVLPWTYFTQSVTEAAELAQPETFDHLHLVGDLCTRPGPSHAQRSAAPGRRRHFLRTGNRTAA